MKNNFLNLKVKKLDESLESKFSIYATKLNKEKKKMISLGLGEPPFGTPKHIMQSSYIAMKNGFTKYSTAVLPVNVEIIIAIIIGYLIYTKKIDALIPSLIALLILPRKSFHLRSFAFLTIFLSTFYKQYTTILTLFYVLILTRERIFNSKIYCYHIKYSFKIHAHYVGHAKPI